VSAVAVVQQLYRDYSWELIFFSPPRGWEVLTNEPRDVLAKYFDDNLTSLIVADQQCVVREQGECNIDGSPIWASNDPHAFDLVVAATKDPTTVAVTFHRGPSPSGGNVRLSYRMVRTSKGWRIRDIVQEDGWSFLAQLKRKIGS
jgi:hypothetical protein